MTKGSVPTFYAEPSAEPTASDKQILCKSCRFCMPDNFWKFSGLRFTHARCGLREKVADKAIRWDLTGGAPVEHKQTRSCAYERGEFGRCGPDGKLYEPKI